MKAIEYMEYGAPEEFHLNEMAKPDPKSNEVLIRVYASTVTAADIMMRKGKPMIGRLYLGLKNPKDLSWDLNLQGRLWKQEKMLLYLKLETKCSEERLPLAVMQNMYV